jgi:hypothetical protein
MIVAITQQRSEGISLRTVTLGQFGVTRAWTHSLALENIALWSRPRGVRLHSLITKVRENNAIAMAEIRE